MRKTTIMLLLLAFTAGLAAQKPRLVVPVGHTNSTLCAVFSPNGKQVLTGSADETAKLWDLNGRELQHFELGHYVSFAIFSPPCPDDPEGGRYVLLGSFNERPTLWNIAGKLIHSFPGSAPCAFSPNGKFILSTIYDYVQLSDFVQLSDLDGNPIRQFNGHSGRVTSVVFSPDGKSVLTGSEDGKAILSDLDGNQIQTFEDDISSGILSVAFSPACPTDPVGGKYILTGHSDRTAKLWDLSGKLVQRFVGHKGSVGSLAFSPDGQSILTGSDDNTAMLWDLLGNPIQTFRSNGTVAFSPACPADPKGGKYVLTCDQTAKQWDMTGNLVKSYYGHASSRITFVAFDPEDKKTGVNGNYILTRGVNGIVCRWNIGGRSVHTFKIASDKYYAPFASDGKSVLALNESNSAMRWDYTGHAIQSFKGHHKDIRCLAFSPDGKSILSGSKDKTAKLWDLAGNCVRTFSGHRETVESIAFSPACPADPSGGKFVLTGSYDSTAILWDLQGNKIRNFQCNEMVSHVAFSNDGKSFLTVGDHRMVTRWDSAGNVLYNFDANSMGGSDIAFSPANADILIGTYLGGITLYDADGGTKNFEEKANTRHRSVCFSPDGKFILTSRDDNVIKLWDTESGDELATLIFLDSTDWVVTTPSGLFDASPDAMNLMHFMVGTEAIDLEQLKERYYEPGLLGKLMGLSNEPLRSVAAFKAIAMYPRIQLQLDSVKHQLRIALEPRDGGMGKLSIFVNDKEIIEDALQGAGPGWDRDTAIVLDLAPYARYFLTDTFNTIAVRAYNRENWLRSPLHSLSYRPEFVGSKGGPGQTAGPSPFRKKPRAALHLLLVGVADYAGSTLDLRYPAKDAEDMAAALRQAGGQLFGADSVFVYLLSTTPGQQQPTKANIQTAFDSITAKAKAEDILLAYFSGHGVNYGEAEKSLFYFLSMETGSFDLSDPGIRAARAISSEELTRWINKVPAQKQVLIVDACNSGKIMEDMGVAGKSLTASQIRALDRMKDRTGMFILSGSAADQKSFEASKFRQSLLTYSLLEAMQSGALNLDKDIDVMRLFEQACTRVRELAAELSLPQEPVPNYPRNASTIFIGRVNEKVKIELARPGLVFVSSVFLDEAQFNDPLNLADAVNNHLREENAAGAGFLFFDLKNIPDAYSIKGLYTLSGEAVSLRARLFKGEAVVGEAFTVTGKRDDVPGLVKALMKQVDIMLK